METRLEALELKFAYQEQAISELSDALIAQQQRMDQLEQSCADLKTRFAALQDSQSGEAIVDERPPHY